MGLIWERIRSHLPSSVNDMDNSKVTVSCIEKGCAGIASLHDLVCPVCRTPLLKRYLRVLSSSQQHRQPGTLIGDRYWVTHQPQIVLDTKPDKRPVLTDEIPESIEIYLRLSYNLLHCPQVFGLTEKEGDWLLEYSSIALGKDGTPQYRDLFPSLVTVWTKAEPLQQLNWLIQIAQLIPEFINRGAASTFYDLALLGINGGLLQVRSLQFDQQKPFDFQKLGSAWQHLLCHQPHPIIKDFCHALFEALVQGEINDPQTFIEVLDTGLMELGRSHYDYRYSLYAQTDAGPSRKHNEDVCYPASGRMYQNKPLAIVCDGIGGHEKGEVAAAIAIEFLQQQLVQLSPQSQSLSIESVKANLNEAILQANDAISDRNDAEMRQERERMGTTLVMAWARHPDFYFAHVGDSRIYRITADSCHQLTFDDDLGSREVRLGYALYQDALSYPSSGALVQALGMSGSGAVHPTIQRLIPAEDSIYLLCSDGLSDNGRVDQYWQSEILPVIKRQGDLQQVGQRLIELANTKNGHDNATIVLFYVQVNKNKNTQAIAFPNLDEMEVSESPLVMPTIPMTKQSITGLRPQRRVNPIAFLIGVLGVVGIGLLLFQMWRRSQEPSTLANPPAPIVNPSPIPTTTPKVDIPPTAIEEFPAEIITNQIVQLRANKALKAFSVPQTAEDTEPASLWIPGGSLLKVLRTDPDTEWVLLELCSAGAQAPPSNSPTALTVLSEGNRGWSPIQALGDRLDAEVVLGEADNKRCEENVEPPPAPEDIGL